MLPSRGRKDYTPAIAIRGNGDRSGAPRRRAPQILRFVLMVGLLIGTDGLWGSAQVAASEKVVQIRVVHRDAAEMLTLVKPLVSQYGFVSADVPSNSLIVIDEPANVDRITRFVAQIDQPVPQLKIRVQYGYQDAEKEQSISTRGKIEVGDATIGVGKKKDEGIDIDLKSDRRQRLLDSEYTVTVRSGSTAYISSGYDVPYPERWARLSRKHGHIHRTVTFKKVDTGYDVRPVLMGNNVQIEIMPHISYINPRGLRQPIRFAEAATRLLVPLGEWVEIAGTTASQQEINREILGGGRTSGDRQLSMRLMVTRH
jgi:type II secretory pathway component GspD/PulD (secretin)